MICVRDNVMVTLSILLALLNFNKITKILSCDLCERWCPGNFANIIGVSEFHHYHKDFGIMILRYSQIVITSTWSSSLIVKLLHSVLFCYTVTLRGTCMDLSCYFWKGPALCSLQHHSYWCYGWPKKQMDRGISWEDCS